MDHCVACPSGNYFMLASERPDSKLYVSTSIGPVAQRIRHRHTEPQIAGASPAGVICTCAARHIWENSITVFTFAIAAFYRTCTTKQECSGPFVPRHAVRLLWVVTRGYFEGRFHCSDLAVEQDKASVVHHTHCDVTARSMAFNYEEFLRSTDWVEMRRVCNPMELPNRICAAPQHP
jgi:hypothetical protein